MMLLFLSATLAIQSPAPGDFYSPMELTLSSIIQVESKGDPHAKGKKGERGLYQFTRSTWEYHTKEPFSRAFDRTVSTGIAVKHYDWIVAQFVKEKRTPTAVDIYIVWNTGFEYYKHKGFNPDKVCKQTKHNVAKFKLAYNAIYTRN